MKYTVEVSLRNFGAWSGGRETLDRLVELDKCDEVEQYIDDVLPDATETDINDFLRFEDEYIATEVLGYDSVDAFYSDDEGGDE